MVVLDLRAGRARRPARPVAFTSAAHQNSPPICRTRSSRFRALPDKGDRSGLCCGRGHRLRIFLCLEDDIDTIVRGEDPDVDGKVVAIVDDIATGGTICRAADALRAQGATAVHAACCHGLFAGGAIHRLSSFVDGVHATNLPNPRGVIQVARACSGVHSILNTWT